MPLLLFAFGVLCLFALMEYWYNPAEKRWSYGHEPQNASLWIAIIRDYLADKIPDDPGEYMLDID